MCTCRYSIRVFVCTCIFVHARIHIRSYFNMEQQAHVRVCKHEHIVSVCFMSVHTKEYFHAHARAHMECMNTRTHTTAHCTRTYIAEFIRAYEQAYVYASATTSARIRTKPYTVSKPMYLYTRVIFVYASMGMHVDA